MASECDVSGEACHASESCRQVASREIDQELQCNLTEQ